MAVRAQPRSRERGVSLLDVLIVVALVAVLAAATVTLASRMLARESLRNAALEVQSAIQLNRIEAVNRNRACHLVVDVADRSLAIWDGMGTASDTDDQRLHYRPLPQWIRFERPDTGDPVTFPVVDATTFRATFDSDGTVLSGEGEVVLLGGGNYRRVKLYVAGGVRIETWDGTNWTSS